MGKKIRIFSRLALVAGSLLAVTGCVAYTAGGGYANGDRDGAYSPYAENVYRSAGGRPYYDRGFHERRDWGDHDARH